MPNEMLTLSVDNGLNYALMNERASRTERLLSFNKNANRCLEESRFSDRPSLTRMCRNIRTNFYQGSLHIEQLGTSIHRRRMIL